MIKRLVILSNVQMYIFVKICRAKPAGPYNISLKLPVHLTVCLSDPNGLRRVASLG